MLVRHVDALRGAVRATQRDRTFYIDTKIVPPDHTQTIWALPGDSQNLAVLRNIALNVVNLTKAAKLVVHNKRLRADWDDSYLAEALART